MKVRTKANVQGRRGGQRNLDGEERTDIKVSKEGKVNRSWGLTRCGKYGNKL